MKIAGMEYSQNALLNNVTLMFKWYYAAMWFSCYNCWNVNYISIINCSLLWSAFTILFLFLMKNFNQVWKDRLRRSSMRGL